MPDRGAKTRPGPGRVNGGEGLAAADVAAFLRRNPDFLEQNPELLDVLQMPGRNGGAGVIDFQQAMVERLRHQVAEATEERDALITTGRSNLSSQSRIHRAVLAFLGARSFEQLIERATTDLTAMLDLDVVMLGVERADLTLPRPRLGGICQLDQDTVDSLIGRGRQIRLRADVGGDPMLFGPGAGLVASDALIRLSISSESPPALLALGARQPDHFHPGQGTELLLFLAESLQSCIRGWLNLPD